MEPTARKPTRPARIDATNSETIKRKREESPQVMSEPRKVRGMAERSAIPKFFDYSASACQSNGEPSEYSDNSVAPRLVIDEDYESDDNEIEGLDVLEQAIEKQIAEKQTAEKQFELSAEPVASAFNMPPTPESVIDAPMNFVTEKRDENENLVCRVLPIMLGYKAVKITKVVVRTPNPKPQERTEESADEVEEYIPQKKNRPMMEFSIATELIPYGSPYWKEIIEAIRYSDGSHQIKVKSTYDDVNMTGRIDQQGKIYAFRDYKYALVAKNWSDFPERNARPAARVYLESPHEIRSGKFPTDFIPVDSPYYATLMVGLRFPISGHRWYNRRGHDGCRVFVRLDSNRTIFIRRNGITVMLYNGKSRPKSSTIPHTMPLRKH